jgi:thiamine biosynthesis lipoprotein
VPLKRAEECWGTVISIDVRSDVDPAAVDDCYAWFRRVDDLFSTWRPDTEIMRIGRDRLRVEDASPEVQEVLEACEQMRLESHGAFDIRAGAHRRAPARPGLAPLDPSGFVKGWAIGKAATRLDDAGASCFSINAGGDVLVRGTPDGSAGWRVGVQHPWETGRVAAVVEVSDRAVATSGRYERGDHVLTPATGIPATGMASVTVIGPDPGVADAFATAAVVLGPAEGMRWLATRVGYEGFGITDSRAALLTPGFDRFRVS